jgi:hypothetical protein
MVGVGGGYRDERFAVGEREGVAGAVGELVRRGVAPHDHLQFQVQQPHPLPPHRHPPHPRSSRRPKA